MNITIGVVIPCYKGHIKYLERLFDSIDNQTKKPDLVIVSCSSSLKEDIKEYCYDFNLKIYTNEKKMNASENRNFGSKIIGTDIISYIDADDIMHPQRLELIYKSFSENENLKLLLHSYITGDECIFLKYDLNKIILEIDPFYVNNYGSVCHQRGNLDIMNSQTSILKEVFEEIQYDESVCNVGKEDTLFNANFIKKYAGKKYTGYIENRLSYYNPSSSY